VIGPVVYILPNKDPPQPVTDSISEPVPSVTVKLVVWPWVTVADPGVIAPVPVPEVEVVTVKVDGGEGITDVCLKRAATEQDAVIGPVV
jgi:hypothetical protein